MICEGFLNVNPRGTARFTKNKVSLDWNELSIGIRVEIPDKMFERPIINASIKVDESILPKEQPIDVIINTKELIEESTGAKINFEVVEKNEE